MVMADRFRLIYWDGYVYKIVPFADLKSAKGEISWMKELGGRLFLVDDVTRHVIYTSENHMIYEGIVEMYNRWVRDQQRIAEDLRHQELLKRQPKEVKRFGGNKYITTLEEPEL
jgi:hypothetical protein